jgi:phage-related protein
MERNSEEAGRLADMLADLIAKTAAEELERIKQTTTCPAAPHVFLANLNNMVAVCMHDRVKVVEATLRVAKAYEFILKEANFSEPSSCKSHS